MKNIFPYERGKKLCHYNSHKNCGEAKWSIRVPHRLFNFTHRYVCEHHAHMYIKRNQKITDSQKHHYGWPSHSKDDFIGVLP